MPRTSHLRTLAAALALATLYGGLAAALSGQDSTAVAATATATVTSGATTSAAATRTILLGYSTRFAGVSQDGELNVWEGAIGGELNGDMHLTVKLLGAPAEAARPVWRVKASVLVKADHEATTFAADLDGTIDWKAGTVRLRGAVVEGRGDLKGAPVMLEGDLRNYDTAGVVRLTVPSQVARR